MIARWGTALVLIAGMTVSGVSAALAAEPAVEPPVGPDPALLEWSDWPFQVTCWSEDDAFDPLEVFAGPTGAERGTSPPERALRRFLKRGPLDWVQKRHWRLVTRTTDTAQFAHGRLDGELEWLGFSRRRARWSFDSYSSDCDPAPVINRGTVVTWRLSRKQRRLDGDTRTIWIDLGPGECASGARQNPRARFYFRTLGSKLLMIAWLRPIRGGGTCLGTIEPSRKVRLPFRLGDYLLYDGSTFPPLRAGQTRDRY